MSARVDLDDLERKARAAPTDAWLVEKLSDGRYRLPPMPGPAVDLMAGASPSVVLALVLRIGALELALIAAASRISDMGAPDVASSFGAIVAHGTVIP